MNNSNEIEKLRRLLAEVSGSWTYTKAKDHEFKIEDYDKIIESYAKIGEFCRFSIVHLPAILNALEATKQEIERLKRGDFTPEEFQNLCHHLDKNPNCKSCDFYDGCHDYQKNLFGVSEREILKKAICNLTNDLQKVKEFAKSLEWKEENDLVEYLEKLFTFSKSFNNTLRNDLEKVNEFARSLGWGQGDLDSDLAGCIKKSFDDLEKERYI